MFPAVCLSNINTIRYFKTKYSNFALDGTIIGTSEFENTVAFVVIHSLQMSERRLKSINIAFTFLEPFSVLDTVIFFS